MFIKLTMIQCRYNIDIGLSSAVWRLMIRDDGVRTDYHKVTQYYAILYWCQCMCKRACMCVCVCMSVSLSLSLSLSVCVCVCVKHYQQLSSNIQTKITIVNQLVICTQTKQKIRSDTCFYLLYKYSVNKGPLTPTHQVAEFTKDT